MKASIRIISVMACVLFFQVSSSAQCINKFPYTQDFENFQNNSSTSSCTVATLGDTSDGWTQEQSDAGEWRSDSSGTPSYLTGPGSSFTSTGSPFGTDYNPGTRGGIYLYTESSGNTCEGGEMSLLSPCFDLSGTTDYKLEFAYHMSGGGIGSLHIDVLDSTTWVKDVWVRKGHQNHNWNVAKVNLARFKKGNTLIRIRAVMGKNWAADIAIDDVKILSYTPDSYNISLVEVVDTLRDYYMTTANHLDTIRHSVRIRNNGSSSAGGVTLKATCGAWSHTQSIGSLAPWEDTTVFLSTFLIPSKTGQESIKFDLSMSSTDADTSDNSRTLKTGFNDTVVAKDNEILVGAIGLTLAGPMGQMMELKNDDTLTGLEYFAMAPVPGDSVRMHIYGYASGVPTNIIASTDYIKFDSGRWYRANFPCDRPLSAGLYFVAVEQLSANNMSIGSTVHAFEPNTTMFWSGTQWVDLTAQDYPYALMIRMVFGKINRPTAKITSLDSICAKQRLTVTASGGKDYLWGPAANIGFPKNPSTIATSDTNFTLTLKTWDACGIPSLTTSKFIKINKIPQGQVSPDTTICLGESVTISASGGNSYRWINGPSNSSWNITPTKGESYQVVFDSSNGCKLTLSTLVSVERVVATASADTAICSGESVSLSASGGTNYTWTPGGLNGNPVSVSPATDTRFIVEAKSDRGCVGYDSVDITVHRAPDLKMPHDTIVCFGQRFEFEASGADSFQWKDGPSTAKYSVLPILSKWFYLDGINKNGCTKTDSVYMLVAPVPRVSLRDDTTICEKTVLDLEAQTTNKVEFKWSNGDTSRTIKVSPSQETTFKVWVKNNGNCSDSAEVTINVDPLPVIDIGIEVQQGKLSVTNSSLHTDNHKWTFGDGDESTDKSPFHKYADTGTYQVKYVATNNCGEVDTSFTIVHDWVSVPVSPEILGLKVFPQPVRDEIFIKVEDAEIQDLTIKIFDLNGRLIISEETRLKNRQSSVKLTHLPAGSYLMLVQTSKGDSRHMIIRQ